MRKVLKQNEVTVIGRIVTELRFNHDVFGEKMYVCDVEIERRSGQVDVIPVMISERLLDHDLGEYYDRMCKVCGTYKSYNVHMEMVNPNASLTSTQTFSIQTWMMTILQTEITTTLRMTFILSDTFVNSLHYV